MPRYKPAECNGLFIPVVLDEQIQPGTFEFALRHLVDDELDLTAHHTSTARAGSSLASSSSRSCISR